MHTCYFKKLEMSSTHCVNQSMCPASEFLISHTFQRKHYISIAHTGHFIMYATQSQLPDYYNQLILTLLNRINIS